MGVISKERMDERMEITNEARERAMHERMEKKMETLTTILHELRKNKEELTKK